MELLTKQIMQRNVQSVSSNLSLPDLEKAFVTAGVSGFPVVDEGVLVGIVSRSDVVKQLFLEHEAAETTSDFYFDRDGFHEEQLVTFEQIADRVGERIERLQVSDVMSRNLVKVGPDQTLRAVAQQMSAESVHRVLVTEQDQLVGIVTSFDLVELLARGRVAAVDRWA